MPNPWDNDPIVQAAPGGQARTYSRDEAGHIWETDAQGNAVRLVQQAAPQASPYVIPPDPRRLAEHQTELAYKAAEQARAAAAAARDTQARHDAHAKDIVDLQSKGFSLDPNGNPVPIVNKASGDTSKTGEAYLATLPPPMAAQVKAYATGRLLLPTGAALRSPQVQAIQSNAFQYEPGLDEGKAKARWDLQQSIAKGAEGKQLTSLNTAIGHVGQLYGQIPNVAGHAIPLVGRAVNAVENAYENQSGDPGITNYTDTQNKLAEELTKFYKGGPADVGGAARAIDQLSPNASTAQKTGGLKNSIELLTSPLDEMYQRYAAVMGPNFTMNDMLDDHTKQVIANLDPDYAKRNGLVIGQRTPYALSAPGMAPPSGGSGASGPSGGNGTPGTGGGSPLDSTGQVAGTPSNLSAGAQFSTPQDLAVSNAITQAYQKTGGDIQAMAAASKAAGYEPTLQDLTAWQSGIAQARKTGAPVQFVPQQTGHRNSVQQGLGKALMTPEGTAAASAVSQFGLGALHAVAPDQMDALSALNPKSAAAGGLAGGLAGGAALGGAVPSVAEWAAANPIRAGMAYGGVSGGLNDPQNPVGGAMVGAGLGAVGGAAGKYVAAPVADAVAKSRLGQSFGRGLAQLTGKPFEPAPQLTPTESLIGGAGSFGPNFTQTAANLRNAAAMKLPYSLADADPQLRVLGGSVARKSIDARTLAENTFAPRALGQADRAVAGVNDYLAPVANIDQRGADLLKAGDQAASPSYTMAMDKPGVVDPQISAILQTPAGQSSLVRAKDIAANLGKDPSKLGFDLDGQGNVVLKDAPSFETLQLAKRGMDSVLNDHRDQFGNLDLRGNPMAQSVSDLLGRFNTRLGQLNPDYAAGNATWGQYAQRKDALDLGYSILPKNNIPLSQYTDAISRLKDFTLPEAQTGYATAMADQASKVGQTSNPYSSIYGSPLQQQKVAALFPQGADKFGQLASLEGDMAKTNTETLGGSSTAARSAADSLFDGGALPAAVDAGAAIAGHGVPWGLGIQGAKGLLSKYGVGLSEQKAAALGPTLFDTSNPSGTADMVDQIVAKYNALAARKVAYGNVGGLLGAVSVPAAAGY